MIRGVVCDLDGNVYLSGRPLPGAVEAIATMRGAGVGLVFLSNNPTVDAVAYASRLSGMGIATTPDEVLTSGGMTTQWLRQHHPSARVLLVSEPSLRDELLAADVVVTDDPDRADMVVVSFDRTFDYGKWQAAFDALRRGAGFVATNPDATCPVDGGEVPDCGGIIAALEASSGRRVETVIGKPSRVAARAALDRLRGQLDDPSLAPSEVVIVGDRLGTDIQLGIDAGFATALVLSGVTGREELHASGLQPTYVLAGLKELPGAVGLADASSMSRRPSISRVRENRTHGLKGESGTGPSRAPRR